jgi:hypothetical protein
MFKNLSWTKIGGNGVLGSWDNDDVRSIRTAFTYGNSHYFGVFGRDRGSAAIWKFDGESWSRVFLASDFDLPFNRFGKSLEIGNNILFGAGTAHHPGHDALIVFKKQDNRIVYERSMLTKNNTADSITSMVAVHDGFLLGAGSHFGAPENCAFFQQKGRKIPLIFDESAFGRPELFRGTYCMARHDETIFIGLCAKNPSRAGILEVSVSAFESPGQAIECEVSAVFDQDFVQSIVSHEGDLYATLNAFGREDSVSTGESSSLWRYRKNHWAPVPFHDPPKIVTGANNFNTIASHGDRFLMSSAAEDEEGKGSIVRVWDVDLGDGSLQPIAGGGLGGSWSEYDLQSSTTNSSAWICHLTLFQNSLITSISRSLDGGQATTWMGN